MDHRMFRYQISTLVLTLAILMCSSVSYANTILPFSDKPHFHYGDNDATPIINSGNEVSPTSMLENEVSPTGAPIDEASPTGAPIDEVSPTGMPINEASPTEANKNYKCILQAPSITFISAFYFRSDVCIRWSDTPFASAYDITIYKNGVSSYKTRINNNYFDLGAFSNSYNHFRGLFASIIPTFDSIFGSKKVKISAAIKIVPVDNNAIPSVFSIKKSFTIYPWTNRNEMIFGNSTKTTFKNSVEARRYMTSIKVKVWRLSFMGTKSTASVTLTTHKNVAENVKKIFQAIYNGKEKFPIKSCADYAFRSTPSEHSCGTAIDINPTENYFIGISNIIKVGMLWNPGKNAYSIPAKGDVVNAFNKYGWHWSPDMKWSNGLDYMHFSLMGT